MLELFVRSIIANLFLQKKRKRIQVLSDDEDSDKEGAEKDTRDVIQQELFEGDDSDAEREEPREEPQQETQKSNEFGNLSESGEESGEFSYCFINDCFSFYEWNNVPIICMSIIIICL